jgi:hypothetical protein
MVDKSVIDYACALHCVRKKDRVFLSRNTRSVFRSIYNKVKWRLWALVFLWALMFCVGWIFSAMFITGRFV